MEIQEQAQRKGRDFRTGLSVRAKKGCRPLQDFAEFTVGYEKQSLISAPFFFKMELKLRLRPSKGATKKILNFSANFF